jgi:hypothetical protein
MASEAEIWKRMGREILASPNNDDLRIRFANLLEEDEVAEVKHSERARFIHIQLALASLTPNDPEWMRLAIQADSILLDHEEEWIPDWYKEAGVRDPEFHRGFIECVTVPAYQLISSRDRIFTQSPIRHLDIVELEAPELLEAAIVLLEGDGYLKHLISLRLDGQHLKDEHIEYLNNPSLSGLRWLSIAYNDIGYEGALALTGGHLRDLQFVNLQGNPFDPVEQLTFDQGIVVGRSMEHVREEFPDVGWRRHRVISGLLFLPSRFETVRGYTEDDPESGSGEGPDGSNREDGGIKRAASPPVPTLETA